METGIGMIGAWHGVIGLNDLRPEESLFNVLVCPPFTSLLIHSHRKSLKPKIYPSRSTAAERAPKIRK